MMIVTILIHMIDILESRNKNLQWIQSILGAVFFKGIGASMIYCFFIYYCELYETKYRPTALILI